MDFKNTLDYQYKYFKKFNRDGNIEYDYEKEGVIHKCMPKLVFKGNPFLVTFIQLIDYRFIMLMKYIDKLKRFKWIAVYK